METPYCFKEIPGFPGYGVDNLGEVWSRLVGGQWRKLAPTVKKGYLSYNLYRDGHLFTRYGHQLVLSAFIGPCPVGMESCHGPDPNRANNRLDNLRWDTKSENIRDKLRYGRGHKLTLPQAKEIKARLESGEARRSIISEFGVSRQTVSMIALGKAWNLGGQS